MKRQKQLNERTLELARKEKDRVLMLQEKIRKANEEIQSIKESNQWMYYLGEDFDENATDEQKIEFYNEFKAIK